MAENNKSNAIPSFQSKKIKVVQFKQNKKQHTIEDDIQPYTYPKDFKTIEISEKPKQTKLKLLTNQDTTKIKNILTATFILDLLLGIWFFIISMIPLISNDIGLLTPIFTKPSANTIIFALTPLGYINLLIFIAVLILNIVAIVKRKIFKEKFIYFSQVKDKANIVFLSFFALYVAMILILFFNLYIPPIGVNLLLDQKALSALLTDISNNQIQPQQKTELISLLKKLGLYDSININWTNFGQPGFDVSTSNDINSIRIALINSTNQNKFYTLMYNFNNYDIFISAGWYAIITLFAITLTFYAITYAVVAFIDKAQQLIQQMKDRNKAFLEFFTQLKEAQKQRKINKQKRKQILAEEEALLNNLEDISPTDAETMSQEEFQEKMRANNEIKNKLKELQKQQEEIRKQQSLFIKKKRVEQINRRPLKPKKQEIAIPDKELEEIFKGIEID